MTLSHIQPEHAWQMVLEQLRISSPGASAVPAAWVYWAIIEVGIVNIVLVFR